MKYRFTYRTCFYIVPIWIFLFIIQLSLKAEVRDTAQKTQDNIMAELTFTARNNYTHPFNQVTLDVVFTDPKGKMFLGPAFWNGNNKWKARYSSSVPGTHHFNSICSEAEDKGLNNVTGNLETKSYKGNNLLAQHGALKVSDDKRHFAYKDGTPFFWLGDT